MPAEPKHLLRALALLWARLGSLRIYLAAIVAVVLALASLGFWHLISPRKELAPIAPAAAVAPAAIAGVSPGVAPSSPSAILNPPSSPSSAPALAHNIAITDVTEEMRRGMRGETLVIANIALTPQTTAEKEHVEIDVSFFDLDRDNQMQPTDAQITYQWLTPERDWTDPAPKYLEATYLKPPSSLLSRRSIFAKADPRRDPEHLRYGGFIVRIYSDGQLQDERSKPETLLAARRTIAPPTSRPPAREDFRSSPRDEGESPAVTPPPSSFRPPPSVASQPSTPNSQPALSPTDHRSPITNHASDSLPKGIVVPGKPGFVQSPYDPKFIIDVRGFPPGTLVNDPNTNKPFRVP